jgi:hypothetical protein
VKLARVGVHASCLVNRLCEEWERWTGGWESLSFRILVVVMMGKTKLDRRLTVKYGDK